MGAGAVAWAAAEAPAFVRGLVLVGPFVRELEPPSARKTATGLLYQALFARPWGPWAWGTYYAGSLYPTAKPADLDEYRARLQANLTERGRIEALAKMMSLSKADVEARLGEVQAPVLVLMGSKDPDFPDPAAEARLVAERLNGRAALVEGAGHYPHAEMPEKAAPLILDFLRAQSD
jgi:pimeloyl-ACP methyl ester carboxylesterase